MDELRKTHNLAKRQFIWKWVPHFSTVLDCGCGRGGDLAKWNVVKVKNLYMIDPDEESLQEAQNRAHEINIGAWFLGKGDVRDAVKQAGPWDIVCYNFSLQYIFENDETFEQSIEAIAKAVKPGGRLIGILPDMDRIEICLENNFFKDELGNTIELKDQKLFVKLVDGPFYAGTVREEPIVNRSKLVKALEERGFHLSMWSPMLDNATGRISDIYSKFVFSKYNSNDTQ